MKTKQNTPAIEVSTKEVIKLAAAIKADNAELAAIKTAESYKDRARSKAADVCSLSNLFNNTRDAYTIGGVQLITDADFSAFRDYVKTRHGIAADDKTTSPRRWSAWYGVQFAEKLIKAHADDPTAATYAAANAYLFADKAARRAELHAAKVARQNAANARK